MRGRSVTHVKKNKKKKSNVKTHGFVKNVEVLRLEAICTVTILTMQLPNLRSHKVWAGAKGNDSSQLRRYRPQRK